MISIALVKIRLRLIDVLKVHHFDEDLRNRFVTIHQEFVEELEQEKKGPRICVDCGCRVTNMNPRVNRCSFCYEKIEDAKPKREYQEHNLFYEGQVGRQKNNIPSEAYERPEEFK